MLLSIGNASHDYLLLEQKVVAIVPLAVASCAGQNQG